MSAIIKKEINNMSEEKVQLKVMGFAFNQIQTGAHVLVLGEVGGMRRLPIPIGQVEAQAIAIQLQGVEAPRPVTHDLICQVMQEYNIGLREVYIFKWEEGIFYSRLICRREAEETKFIEARTSDAIALAVRTGSPIYIERDAFMRMSISFNTEGDQKNVKTVNALSSQTVEELQKKLEQIVKEENYELAAKIRDEINSRN